MIDVFSVIPLDYIMWNNDVYGTWFRLLRFLKIYRIQDTQEVLRRFFSSFHLFNIIILGFFYLLASHIGACIFYLIALFEYNRGGRFDGKDFVSFTILIIFSSLASNKDLYLSINYQI